MYTYIHKPRTQSGAEAKNANRIDALDTQAKQRRANPPRWWDKAETRANRADASADRNVGLVATWGNDVFAPKLNAPLACVRFSWACANLKFQYFGNVKP